MHLRQKPQGQMSQTEEIHYTQYDHFQQFYNRCNVKVDVPIIRWSHCGTNNYKSIKV